MKRAMSHGHRRGVHGLSVRPARRVSAAGPPDVVCSQVTKTFAGTAHDLIVPTGGYCAVTGATITHDLIQLDHAGADVSGTSVGHDVRFEKTRERGSSSSTVGHDIVAAGDESGAGVFGTAVGHDMLALGEDSGFDIAGVKVVHDVRCSASPAGFTQSVSPSGTTSSPRSRRRCRRVRGPEHAGGPGERRSRFCDRRLRRSCLRLRWHLRPAMSLRDFSVTNRSVTLGFGHRRTCARERPAGEHDRPRHGHHREYGARPDSSARRRSSSATTTSAATSCSATTRRWRAGQPRGVAERRRSRRELRGEQPGGHGQRAEQRRALEHLRLARRAGEGPSGRALVRRATRTPQVTTRHFARDMRREMIRR